MGTRLVRAALTVAGILAAFIVGLHLGAAHAAPRLVAFGCIGAAGPIYADAESDLPRCLDIQTTN